MHPHARKPPYTTHRIQRRFLVGGTIIDIERLSILVRSVEPRDYVVTTEKIGTVEQDPVSRRYYIRGEDVAYTTVREASAELEERHETR